jgi:hypothetical protein
LIAPVAYVQQLEDLPEPPDPLPLPETSPELIPKPSPLELPEVIRSVQVAYPLLIGARFERQVVGGRQVSAWGAFDLELKGFGIAAPQGFYKNYRNGVAMEQPLFCGGYLYGGYKIGDGSFQPWFGERQTNEGGEFSAGFGVPLLKDREIDKRREGVFKTGLARQAVEPVVRSQLLEFVRLASQAYWSWVAAGQSLEAQRELLELAQERVEQIQARVEAEDLGQISSINNDQLIALRETKVIESERKLQEASIKLSLFFRNAQGTPVIPTGSRLPVAFPDHTVPDDQQLDEDIARALAARPELSELNLLAQQVRVELAQAENMLLPKLDGLLLASKDVGAPASSKGDKTPFELEVGLLGEVPLQRREARGKIESARGKLAQIQAKRQFVIDKVTALVQDAVSALEAAAGRIEQSRLNLKLARDTLALGRLQFEVGDIDIIALNIYERAVTDAQLLLIQAQADYFTARADYRAALSMDPLTTSD